MAAFRPHMEIGTWLENLDLPMYKTLFKDYNGVEDILWMSERELKNIGIKNGSHRARISTSITALKEKYNKTHKDPQFGGSTLSTHNSSRSLANISRTNRNSLETPHSGVRSWPSSGPSSSHSTQQSSPRSSIDSFIGAEATPDELRRALERELSLDSSDLRSYAWYHGTILRQRAEELVAYNGDFIIRDCISQPGDYVVTCKWKEMPLHFIVNKVIMQPDTVYEKVQYCFEQENFDSIPDFITYYVGSKCPLSVASGAILGRPINRSMPLSYYSSRYGVHCQIHYAAKALERLPSSPSEKVSVPADSPVKMEIEDDCVSPLKGHLNAPPNQRRVLNRVGSDPMISPSTERRTFEHRPNSGSFSSEIAKEIACKGDKPPPKPSRVPSKRLPQRPFVVRRERKPSVDSDIFEPSLVPGALEVPPHGYRRLVSETRFNFLDRPSVSDDGSTISDSEVLDVPFSIPPVNPPSVFEPSQFWTPLLRVDNMPLEGSVLSHIKQLLNLESPKKLACHLTRIDLDVAKNYSDEDLGLGVASGLELFLLPQGSQLQKDLMERTQSMKLFVAITILTCMEEEDRVKLIYKWIEIAVETKTTFGNLYGFTAIMLGLTLPEVIELHSTWDALRQLHTNTTFAFETKLRPAFLALQRATTQEAPNTCLPYILSLLLILNQHFSIMQMVHKNTLNEDAISNAILSFNFPGDQNTDDFGLQLLEDQLEMGRSIMQQFPTLKKNGEISLQNVKYEEIVLDIFRTEFHLRLLWGCRGAVVATEERFEKFGKVLCLLHQRCNQA